MKEYLQKFFFFILTVLKWFFILSIFSVILFRFIPIPFTPLMLQRCVEQFMSDKPIKLKKDWVSFEELPNHLQLAVVCAEDQNFINHMGFDLEAIEKAVKHNKRHKRTRGASTISQQTAKNVFLLPSRNWLRKGLEVYFTGLIELFWSKERIMTVYLNIVELGDGVYGAEAASNIFFNKPARKLSPPQSALLASVLPNPLKYKVKNPGPYVQRRQQWVLRQMGHWDYRLRYE